jgi:hypothetical protein
MKAGVGTTLEIAIGTAAASVRGRQYGYCGIVEDAYQVNGELTSALLLFIHLAW